MRHQHLHWLWTEGALASRAARGADGRQWRRPRLRQRRPMQSSLPQGRDSSTKTCRTSTFCFLESRGQMWHRRQQHTASYAALSYLPLLPLLFLLPYSWRADLLASTRAAHQQRRRRICPSACEHLARQPHTAVTLRPLWNR